MALCRNGLDIDYHILCRRGFNINLASPVLRMVYERQVHDYSCCTNSSMNPLHPGN
ncbi:unnamed protein product [Larinioides sclopetarius]|uniref:Uncharacterized protein n=1 Tax=Larinioides sclopetarius TaxID=280406 RepID=A0AAV1ZPT4_9ARAC